jgi:hypothetical protein
MTNDLAPTRQALAVEGRSAPLKVTGKLRIAIDTMVWSGLCRADAAKAAGLKDKSLKSALRKGHVKAAYLAELEVLRLSARARAFHRLVELSEQDDNRGAAVAAVRTMVLEGDDAAHRGHPSEQTMPGLVIRIVTAGEARVVGPVIDNEPDER